MEEIVDCYHYQEKDFLIYKHLKEHQWTLTYLTKQVLTQKPCSMKKNVQGVICDILLRNLCMLSSFCSKMKINDLNSSKVEIEKLDTKLDHYFCKKL